MDTGCRDNRITDFSKRPSGKKRFVMNTRIAVAMTQNEEYVPTKDTDNVNEDEDVDANCPPSEDDDKSVKKGKKRKHPSCQSNEEEPKLKKKSPPVKEGERKLTKKTTTSNINALSAIKKCQSKASTLDAHPQGTNNTRPGGHIPVHGNSQK